MILRTAKRITSRSLDAAYRRRLGDRFTAGVGCVIPFNSLQADVQRLELGDYVRLGERMALRGTSFIFGDHCYTGNEVTLAGTGGFVMGKFSSLGERVSCRLGRSHHRMHTAANFPFGRVPQFDDPAWIAGEAPDVGTACTIGNDVWVGMHVIIQSHVTIGDGAVVSAGSVVTHDVPPYAIVGGNPAQLIAFRFKPSLIAELLELRWWDWPIEKIRRNRDFLSKNLMTRAALAGVPIV
jgi:acetyltransferase-like isoleucine patch superfamily enzyme